MILTKNNYSLLKWCFPSKLFKAYVKVMSVVRKTLVYVRATCAAYLHTTKRNNGCGPRHNLLYDYCVSGIWCINKQNE